MIYVLKTQNKDVIIFDSILSFSETYSGNVTSHPVEDGTKISDHVITENIKFRIQGVVSDYNFWNPLKDAANYAVPVYENGVYRYSSMGVVGTDGMPAFSTESVPQDYLAPGDENLSVKAAMLTVKNKLIQIQRNKEFVTILGYTLTGHGSEIEKWDNCIITDLSFDTSPESGYAIYPNINIDQVNVVRVKTQQANAEKITEQKIGEQAAGEDGKGNKKPVKAKTDGDAPQTNKEAHQPKIDRNAKAEELKRLDFEELVKMNPDYKNGIIGTLGY